MSTAPLQKMVVVASPPPNELEQKKKRQTAERAKANHLSKQLQMRLQYAKLKVEHGWQRQNLNEVENLYFHHSHLRNIRQSAEQRPHSYVAATNPPPAPPSAPVLVETRPIQSPVQSGVPDHTLGPSQVADDTAPPDSVSPHSRSPSEHPDGRPSPLSSSHSQPHSLAPSSSSSAFDLSDPNILARLAQLQTHVQLPSQPQSQSQSQTQSSIAVPPSAFTSQPIPLSVPVSSAPSAFLCHLPQPTTSHPQSSFAFSMYAPQPLVGTPTPGSMPIYPIPPSATQYSAAPSQQPVPSIASTSASAPAAPIPTTPISTSIAPAALTYDSFWSTHASSTGPTRALYRTHTGFTVGATPAGNVAMLTPGGHAAVMTAEGVYVGGGSSRSG